MKVVYKDIKSFGWKDSEVQRSAVNVNPNQSLLQRTLKNLRLN